MESDREEKDQDMSHIDLWLLQNIELFDSFRIKEKKITKKKSAGSGAIGGKKMKKYRWSKSTGCTLKYREKTIRSWS